MDSSVGGTIIEAWSPPEALASCGVTDTGLDDGFNHNEYNNTVDTVDTVKCRYFCKVDMYDLEMCIDTTGTL